MRDGVSFSIIRQAAWAPGLCDMAAWSTWADDPAHASPPAADADAVPALAMMPAMLRRRAGLFGKMALQVAYDSLDGLTDVPAVFCSRHGEVARAVELLTDLARRQPLSPTAFGMAVHNASAGLFSIARADRASHVALAAGDATIEHAVIEACALLADGAPRVLLVAADCPLPPPFEPFDDCRAGPHAFAWLMAPAGAAPLSLRWEVCADDDDGAAADPARLPGTLQVLRFQLGAGRQMARVAGQRRWLWRRDA